METKRQAAQRECAEWADKGERCACDSADCPGSLRERTDGPRERCRDNAVCVVVLLYPTPPSIRGAGIRTVRLPMCRECAAFWTSHEHDGVKATLQVGSEAAR